MKEYVAEVGRSGGTYSEPHSNTCQVIAQLRGRLFKVVLVYRKRLPGVTTEQRIKVWWMCRMPSPSSPT